MEFAISVMFVASATMLCLYLERYNQGRDKTEFAAHALMAAVLSVPAPFTLILTLILTRFGRDCIWRKENEL